MIERRLPRVGDALEDPVRRAGRQHGRPGTLKTLFGDFAAGADDLDPDTLFCFGDGPVLRGALIVQAPRASR